MRLLIVEYLYAGFVRWRDVSQSMLGEGRAMLRALSEDASRMEGVSVTSIRHINSGAPPSGAVRLLETTSPANAARAWQSSLKEADVVYVIAPETDGILRRLCEEAIDSGARVLNCAPDAIEAAGDKWETYCRLRAASIPTINTTLLSDLYVNGFLEEQPIAWVVKPRYGCGSEGIQVITDRSDLDSISDSPEMIIQPFIRGQPASVAAIFGENGRPCDILPLAIQRLSNDLRYLGGFIPALPDLIGVTLDVEQLSHTIERLGSLFSGLRGYVGVDLLVQPDGNCVVVEINPRLTTSYIGYRAITDMNLAERWLSPNSRPLPEISWSARSAAFSADGGIGIGQLS